MPWDLILRIVGPAALVVLLAFGVRWALEDARADGHRAGQAEVHAEWATEKAAAALTAQLAEAEARAEEQRRNAAQKESDRVQAEEIQRARADAAAAGAAADQLRQRVAALVAAARESRGNPAAAFVGPPAEDAAGMLADVLGRCVERVRVLAAVADDRGAAGGACERSYDALTPP